MSKTLLLASQSPRRRSLLKQLGYCFQCLPADIDESIQYNESAEQYVARLALEKAHVATKNYLNNRGAIDSNELTVIGSDTSVVFNQHVLGKPTSLEDCHYILNMLSNNWHQVMTAVAVVQGERSEVIMVSTDVDFKTLTHQEIEYYWHTGEPQDKAGAYGIQGIGGKFVKQIRGSYSAVVGLPLYETAELLTSFGISPLVGKINEF